MSMEYRMQPSADGLPKCWFLSPEALPVQWVCVDRSQRCGRASLAGFRLRIKHLADGVF
jgi:hypothetical protein